MASLNGYGEYTISTYLRTGGGDDAYLLLLSF
jgi:hypothetical protein